MSITVLTADDLVSLRAQAASMDARLTEHDELLASLTNAMTARAENVDAYLDAHAELLHELVNTVTRLRRQVDALAASIAPADVTVEIAPSSFGVSRLEPGVSHVTKDLTGTANAAAKERARAQIGAVAQWHNVHMQAYGAGSIMPWDGVGSPPTVPSFASLDQQAAQASLMGGGLVLTLFGLPWWMRGQTTYTADGQTTVNMTAAQEFGPDASSGRLRTDRIPHWQNLVRQVATRYLRDFACRVFQIGNECKGFYNRSRDGKGQAWDWDDHPGAPGRADMGYTAFYKLTAQAILEAAAALGIPASDIKIGGPYPVIAAQGVPTANSVPAGHPLRDRVWGSANRQGVDAVTGFLDLQRAQGFKFDFLAIDFSTYLTDGVIPPADDFTVAYARFSDYLAWARTTLTAKGYGADFPLALSEWYAKPQVLVPAGKAAYRAAIKAVACIAMLEQGVWMPLMWSPFGLGDGPNVGGNPLGADPNLWEGGLVTPTTDDAGGQALPFLNVCADLHTHFSPGTALYLATPSDNRIAAIASSGMCLLVNRTSGALTVRVGGAVHEIGGYETIVVPRIASLPA